MQLKSKTLIKLGWAPQSLDEIKAIYDYIYEQSPKGADKVFDTLLDLGDR